MVQRYSKLLYAPNKLESKLLDYKNTLGEVATINLLREMGSRGLFSKDVTKLTSYRIETKGLNQKEVSTKMAELER